MFDYYTILKFIVMIISLIFAVSIHEAAHGYIAWKMGDNTAKILGRVTLNPIKHLDLIGSFILPVMLKFTGAPFVFGYAKPVPVNFRNLNNLRKGTIFVASAGIVANIICAIISGILFQIIVKFPVLWNLPFIGNLTEIFAHLLSYSVIINLVLAVFNLIPVPPLDGGRIVTALLPPSLGKSFAKIEPFGMLIIILLLITKSISSILSFFLKPMINILLGY